MTTDEAINVAQIRAEFTIRYHGPACPHCYSRRTKRLADGYPIRVCLYCERSSLYGELIPEKEPKPCP